MSFRSAQLSRQVGAAILTERGDVISVGTNEVPRAGGGQYWERDRNDMRDHKLGEDTNDVFKRVILIEALAAIDPEWSERTLDQQNAKILDLQNKLRGSRLTNLTEFVRALHAEMEALLSATRIGVSTRRAILYC